MLTSLAVQLAAPPPTLGLTGNDCVIMAVKVHMTMKKRSIKIAFNFKIIVLQIHSIDKQEETIPSTSDKIRTSELLKKKN